MRFSLIPREMRFFDLFEEVAATIHRAAVNIGGVLVGLAAADLIIPPGERIRARGRASGLAARYDARNQRHQAVNVASI